MRFDPPPTPGAGLHIIDLVFAQVAIVHIQKLEHETGAKSGALARARGKGLHDGNRNILIITDTWSCSAADPGADKTRVVKIEQPIIIVVRFRLISRR